jgi:3-methyladenine DNA glycosylase Tag
MENIVIRKQDEIKVDQLTKNSTLTKEEQELNAAIMNSIEDFKEIQKQYDDFENNVIQNYEEIKEQREKQFSGFISSLKKVSKYDVKIKEIIEILEPVIEAYCFNYINDCEFDCITYEKIFSELNSVRVEKNVLELLKTIILKNN